MRESLSSTPPVLVAAGSHVGRVRETNEDRIHADPDRGSFAVIDGVGGQAAGEHAAQTALETIRQRLQLQIGTPAERVREAIALANDQIRQQALRHPDRRGMACVLTLVLLQAGQLTAGHVGDTRLYKMRGGALRKLTRDHSPIGEREDRGELSETEAMRHPRRNEVYREVGLEPRGPDTENFIDIVEEPFEPDAALLLCSDGLTDVLSSTAIAEIIHRHAGDPSMVVEQLITQANEAGGKDNISVVYIEGATFAPAPRRAAAAKAARALNGTPVLASPAPGHAAPGHAAPGHAAGQTESVHSGTLASGSIPPSANQSASAGAPTMRALAGGGSVWTYASPAYAQAHGVATPDAAAGTRASSASGASNGSPGSAASSSRSSSTSPSASTSSAAPPAVTARRAGGGGRALMFAIGLLAGAALALGAAWLLRDRLLPLLPLAAAPANVTAAGAPRTLTVGAAPDAAFRTIGQAMSDARAGDTIQVGPGEYREQIVVTDGVTVMAVPAREAVIRAPAQVPQPWTAVIVPGARLGSRVSGLRIAGETQGPIAIGIHVLGRGAIDDVEVSGTMMAGIALAEGMVNVTGAAIHDNAGPGVLLNGGEARVVHTVLARNGGALPQGVDIVLNRAPRAQFTGNVITGDLQQRVRGLASDQVARFREANLVLPGRPGAGAATPARPPAGAPRRAAATSASNR